MELKNKYRLFALGLTLCIHLAVISPFSGWLNQNLLPTLHEEGMEIELIQAENEDEKDQLPVPEEKKEELPPEDLPSDYVFKNLPKETKKLSEDLSEDKIINPFDDKPPRPDSNKDPNKTDWDLIDKILDEPLEKSSIPKAVPEKTAKKQAIKAKAEELLPEDTDSLKGEKLVNTSPLFLKPGEVFKEDNTPREIRKTFKNNRPERTNWDKLEFSMNTYKWSYERFIENWAIDINKWWVAPVDYIAGNIPQGGSVWIRIRLSKQGQLLEYKVFNSNLTSEMELNVIQALIGSLERPALPKDFPEDVLVINWKFIYPPIMDRVKMRR